MLTAGAAPNGLELAKGIAVSEGKVEMGGGGGNTASSADREEAAPAAADEEGTEPGMGGA